MKRRLTIPTLLAAMLLVVSACTSSDGGGIADRIGGGAGGDEGSRVPQPGPLFTGLAHYSSYRLSFELKSTSETGAPVSQTIAIDYSSAEGGWRAVTTSVDEFGETVQDTYWKDGVGCSNDGTGWQPLPFSPEERDLYGALWAGFDMMFRARSPEFVGEETVAGVDAEHYSAAVAGLGITGGAVPTESRVDYWLAAETGALIGYRANVETRTGPADDPSAEVFSLDISLTTSDLDQPVAISPPPDCPRGAQSSSGSAAARGDAMVLPGIAQTLGVYDSYTFVFESTFGSPSLGVSESTMTLSVAADGSFSQVLSQTAEGETVMSEAYWDGEVLCQNDGFAWTAEALPSEQSQLPGALGQQLDFVPVVYGAQAAGSDTIDGVDVTRYEFPVAGVGPGTATSAGGQYWISDDGVLLRYEADLSSQAPDGTAVDGNLSLSLRDLNGDIVVTLPQECTAALVPELPVDTTVGSDPPTPAIDAFGTIGATGDFEAAETLGASDVLCGYDDGFFSFDAFAESGFAVTGLIFELDAVVPGQYEFDDVFALAPIGTPQSDAGAIYERFAGGAGIGDFIIENVAGNQISAVFQANLETSTGGFGPLTVFGGFTCSLGP